MLVFLVSYDIADGQTGNNPEAAIERMINSGSLEGTITK